MHKTGFYFSASNRQNFHNHSYFIPPECAIIELAEDRRPSRKEGDCMNNILFFLTPKAMCAYLYDDYTIRQALEKMEVAGYATLPILNRDGEYRGTLTEGDVLWALKNMCGMKPRSSISWTSPGGRIISPSPSTPPCTIW